MALVLRLLVNAGLLAIPIGATVGALVGIDAHRAATGQSPLFSGESDSSGSGSGSGSNGGSGSDSTGGGSGGGTPTISDGGKVTTKPYCDLSYGITPPTHGDSFTFNPNQWGVTSTSVGELCLNVTTFSNETYATDSTVPAWSVTWQYDQGLSTAPVHAFPNVMVDDIFPISLDSMQEINFDVEWTYGAGNDAADTIDETSLTAVNLNANVAIDMFFDSDKTTSQNSTSAKFEVMVWFATFGTSTDVIGHDDGIKKTMKLNNTTFNLYGGQNTATNQWVYTWKTAETTGTFSDDIYPLIEYLYTETGDDYPTKSDYMGVFQFGTEAFYSASNVTFNVPSMSIDIKS
ncbi:hypothetical protein N7495_004361 [Penicillium taxi]|uniref:uncharacterized protein n=1 Tax=Penicillium taxi TaxID=168475 RepID=UPI002544E330|nr:uncharacterized protein N7495_004361 [Penicillium taxi]KAJ5899617.1 hypothetical protein N7495_004361 [Penicillium taxi]